MHTKCRWINWMYSTIDYPFISFFILPLFTHLHSHIQKIQHHANRCNCEHSNKVKQPGSRAAHGWMHNGMIAWFVDLYLYVCVWFQGWHGTHLQVNLFLCYLSSWLDFYSPFLSILSTAWYVTGFLYSTDNNGVYYKVRHIRAQTKTRARSSIDNPLPFPNQFLSHSSLSRHLLLNPFQLARYPLNQLQHLLFLWRKYVNFVSGMIFFAYSCMLHFHVTGQRSMPIFVKKVMVVMC